ncbi:hypothetical protein AB0D11_02580 [Streptomyces monashensis]|uniref:hypothetical protein n=1 Tax=Streptomyces monashensis TaxID=1678012 RepID=UPI0033DBB202
MGQRGRGWDREIPEGFSARLPDGKPRCWGHSKKTGLQCGRPARPGQHVCRFHGGNAPQTIKAAERRVAEAELVTEVHKQLARLDVAPVDNPLTALAELAGQVVAFKDALADRVNQLSEIRYQAGTGEQVRAELVLFERALDRCNSVLSNMGRLNIDERLARVSEQQVETLTGAVDALLTHLGVTGDQAVEAKRFLARKLRAA